MKQTLVTRRLPRPLHPGAWWLWALGMGTAASRTTNPLLLGLILGVVAFVVSARRTEAPWAKGFKAYLIFGLIIIGSRMVFRMILDGRHGETLLFTLPEIPLPSSAAGIQLGGPVHLEALLAAFYDGLRLATLLCCIGAANVLADPKRLLKAVPAALHEMGVAVTVTLTVAPQLVESAQRIHRARKLRGSSASGRRHLLRGVVVPLLTDALDRSLLLASAMDCRGYGRSAAVKGATRLVAGGLVLAGLLGVCVGTYGLLDAGTPRALGFPMLAGGLVVAGIGFVLAGRRVQRSRYRPDPWRLAEWGVAATGILAAGVMYMAGSVDPANLNPSLQPLQWPPLAVLPVVAILIGVLPAWIAPPVHLPARRSPPAPKLAEKRAVGTRSSANFGEGGESGPEAVAPVAPEPVVPVTPVVPATRMVRP